MGLKVLEGFRIFVSWGLGIYGGLLDFGSGFGGVGELGIFKIRPSDAMIYFLSFMNF